MCALCELCYLGFLWKVYCTYDCTCNGPIVVFGSEYFVGKEVQKQKGKSQVELLIRWSEIEACRKMGHISFGSYQTSVNTTVAICWRQKNLGS